ncbi:DUF4340 domain-containing protein [Simiduia sp. 21SJ11W-1]|uniref:DUF4340 domain-containing protein n=1 Tax=Simiduia sp. 21SJ11W-1 TaxID=2909669 RepID=UPI0020A014F7|nr:DUF4340 domain-containing protein [Simiduia sp. 21SJ11W-1]UTA47049.1 DUF4340 domain-containing protein [Simiduia sp. 21SJ11W-1]
MTTSFKRLPHWLSGLLAAQLLLATGIFWANQQGTQVPATPLLADIQQPINKLTFTEGDQHTTLVKQGDQWLVAGHHKLPAKQSEVEDLLQALKQQKTLHPIATQRNSHARFEVSDENAQHRLEAFAGDTKVAELLLGSSPGLRQVHLRRAGEDAVFVAKLNRYDFSAQAEHWLDRKLLATEAPIEISGPDFTLAKKDDQWRLANAEDKPVDSGKASELARALENLQVQSVAEGVSLESLESTKLEVKIQGRTEPLRYRLAELKGNHYIARDDIPAVFNVSEFDFKRLNQTALTDLIANHEADAHAGQSGS